jgi:hypothetical protein
MPICFYNSRDHECPNFSIVMEVLSTILDPGQTFVKPLPNIIIDGRFVVERPADAVILVQGKVRETVLS